MDLTANFFKFVRNLLTICIFIAVFLSADSEATRFRRFINIPGVSSNDDDFGPRTLADCFLPKRVGVCRAMIPAFYYNNVENRCMSFSYGGCQGNANNFNTFQECQMYCEIPLHS